MLVCILLPSRSDNGRCTASQDSNPSTPGATVRYIVQIPLPGDECTCLAWMCEQGAGEHPRSMDRLLAENVFLSRRSQSKALIELAEVCGEYCRLPVICVFCMSQSFLSTSRHAHPRLEKRETEVNKIWHVTMVVAGC